MSALWDVTTWKSAPPAAYRINTFYRVGCGVVTLTGELATHAATADLRATLAVFEAVAPTLVVDLCHARLDDDADDALAVAGQRRQRRGFALRVEHADAGARIGLRRATDALRGPGAQGAPEFLSIS